MFDSVEIHIREMRLVVKLSQAIRAHPNIDLTTTLLQESNLSDLFQLAGLLQFLSLVEQGFSRLCKETDQRKNEQHHEIL